MCQPLHFLITAGPTREPIDPVRYLSNRSSGKMGYALAAAAAARGHPVVLVSGPVSLAPVHHPAVAIVRVGTAEEMYQAVAAKIQQAQVVVMAAAVADYRPVRMAPQKLKKTGQPHLTLDLERTEDILGSARHPLGFRGLLVGFAAETERLEESARDKLARKSCDLVVANDVSRSDIGFEADSNELLLVFRGGEVRRLPKASKTELASHLIEVIEGLAISAADAAPASHE